MSFDGTGLGAWKKASAFLWSMQKESREAPGFQEQLRWGSGVPAGLGSSSKITLRALASQVGHRGVTQTSFAHSPRDEAWALFSSSSASSGALPEPLSSPG